MYVYNIVYIRYVTSAAYLKHPLFSDLQCHADSRQAVLIQGNDFYFLFDLIKDWTSPGREAKFLVSLFSLLETRDGCEQAGCSMICSVESELEHQAMI